MLRFARIGRMVYRQGPLLPESAKGHIDKGPLARIRRKGTSLRKTNKGYIAKDAPSWASLDPMLNNYKIDDQMLENDGPGGPDGTTIRRRHLARWTIKKAQIRSKIEFVIQEPVEEGPRRKMCQNQLENPILRPPKQPPKWPNRVPKFSKKVKN